MAADLPRIVATPGDIAIAEDVRERVLEALNGIAAIMTEARQKHGFTINFQISPADSFNRHNVAFLEILKKLA